MSKVATTLALAGDSMLAAEVALLPVTVEPADGRRRSHLDWLRSTALAEAVWG